MRRVLRASQSLEERIWWPKLTVAQFASNLVPRHSMYVICAYTGVVWGVNGAFVSQTGCANCTLPGWPWAWSLRAVSLEMNSRRASPPASNCPLCRTFWANRMARFGDERFWPTPPKCSQTIVQIQIPIAARVLNEVNGARQHHVPKATSVRCVYIPYIHRIMHDLLDMFAVHADWK